MTGERPLVGMRRLFVLGWLVACCASGPAWGQQTPAGGAAEKEISQEAIRTAVETGVRSLLSKQSEDGHWVFMEGAEENQKCRVGHTALVVLALQRSGTRIPEARTAMRKGMNYILAQPPEPRTYSAGLVEQALYWDRPPANEKVIAA